MQLLMKPQSRQQVEAGCEVETRRSSAEERYEPKRKRRSSAIMGVEAKVELFAHSSWVAFCDLATLRSWNLC